MHGIPRDPGARRQPAGPRPPDTSKNRQKAATPNQPATPSPLGLGARPVGSTQSLAAMARRPDDNALAHDGDIMALQPKALPRATSEQFLSKGWGDGPFPQFIRSEGTTPGTSTPRSGASTEAPPTPILSSNRFLPDRNPLSAKTPVVPPKAAPEEAKAKLARIESARDLAKTERAKHEVSSTGYNTADADYKAAKQKAKDYRKENYEAITGKKPLSERIKSAFGFGGE